MIKHHPKTELLEVYVSGELPASLSAAIAIHADMCPECQRKIAAMTEYNASSTFEEAFLHTFQVDDSDTNIDFDQMIAEITADSDIALANDDVAVTLNIKGNEYQLPRALRHMPIGSWNSIGKLTRARVNLEEGEIRSSLLKIHPGGSVPEHTHKGFELTVLLSGSFKDEMGEYVPGDFIMLDGKHTHHPVSERGCLCFTVANDAQHFTQGINRLLNPIGTFIY
jgi:putative transcriptional regulator